MTMSQVPILVELGSTVSVDLERVKDRIPSGLSLRLKDDPSGKVLDYKMTDGDGIGYVLQLSDGSLRWFFNDEIHKSQKDTSTQLSDQSNNLSSEFYGNENILFESRKTNQWEPSLGKGLLYLLNPLNFIKWLIYSLKDVF